MMVLSMLIFGGPTLHYFAVALTIGILFGIYSSIFVAAGIVMWLGVKREDLVKTAKDHDPERSERRGGGVESKTPYAPRDAMPQSMATSAAPSSLAGQARRLYTEEVVKGLAHLVQAAIDGARHLLDKPCEHQDSMRRRDLMQELHKGAQAWHRGMVNGLRHALVYGVSASRPGDLPPPGSASGGLSLVDNDTIEVEIVTSRLALAIMDKASWEFADLRSRVAISKGAPSSSPTTCCAPMCWPAGVRCLACGRHQRDQLARTAAGAARRVRAAGRGGLPRDQPLAGRAPGAGRSRPAALHAARQDQPQHAVAQRHQQLGWHHGRPRAGGERRAGGGRRPPGLRAHGPRQPG
jgi:hypothetical protein